MNKEETSKWKIAGLITLLILGILLIIGIIAFFIWMDVEIILELYVKKADGANRAIADGFLNVDYWALEIAGIWMIYGHIILIIRIIARLFKKPTKEEELEAFKKALLKR